MLVGYPHLAEDLWHWCQGHPGPILEAWSWNGGNGKIMAKSRKNRENRRKWRLIAGKTIYFSWEMFQQAKLQVKTQVFSVENIIHIYIYIPLNPIHWRLHPREALDLRQVTASKRPLDCSVATCRMGAMDLPQPQTFDVGVCFMP